MPNSKIDEVIQEALGDSANEIEFDADLFADIKAGVFSPSWGRARFYDISLAIGRKILLTAGAISILFLACALFSKDVRVMATELYNAVKTIFVVKGTADNYQVVEKPVEDQLFTHGVSQETQLSDSEISQKVGYHVSFPYVLAGDFFIDYKAMGVVLEKQMNYNQGQELETSMNKAITDDQELEKLKEYGPKRTIFATYRNSNWVTVFIHINPGSNSIPLAGQNVVSIGRTHGLWLEFPYADYPMKEENGIGGSDLSQKPNKVITTHSLVWDWNGLRYQLSFYKGNELSLEESVKVAESFMERQK